MEIFKTTVELHFTHDNEKVVFAKFRRVPCAGEHIMFGHSRTYEVKGVTWANKESGKLVMSPILLLSERMM